MENNVVSLCDLRSSIYNPENGSFRNLQPNCYSTALFYYIQINAKTLIFQKCICSILNIFLEIRVTS